MTSSAHFEMQCAAYEGVGGGGGGGGGEDDASDDDKEREEEEDYSFSLSGFLGENAYVDQAMLSTLSGRALEDSISFTFSTEKAPNMRDSDFPSTLPLLKHEHSCDLESSSIHDSLTHQSNNADHETAALILFRKTGSRQADSPFLRAARHRKMGQSFSIPTDVENEKHLSEMSLVHFREAITRKDSSICSDDEGPAVCIGATHCGDVAGKLHMHKAHCEITGHQDGFCKPHPDVNEDHRKVKLVNKCERNTDTGNNHVNLFTHQDHIKDNDYGLLLHEQSARVEPNLRFAGEGLLQPWSSSKLSKSGKRRVANAEKNDLHGISHRASHDSTTSRHSQPLPLYAPAHIGIKDNFNSKQGTQLSGRIRLSESTLFSPSSVRKVGSPTHEPVCMPRKSNSLFARRKQNTSETLSLLVHAQKPANTSFTEAGLPSPSSNESANSSSYRTSRIGSTQSSGYSSSSGTCSTPNSSRRSRKKALHVAARSSLQQRMDAEPFKLQKQEDPNTTVHRKGGTTAQLHRKGNVYSTHAQTAAQRKVKADMSGAGHGVMSPSTASSQSPRSPLSWRAVLSLQPLNPSHVPVDQWAKPSSRSRSRSSSRGSSGTEGRSRNASLSAATSKDLLLVHSISNGKKTSSWKGNKSPASNQKLVKTGRGGYWALNPMQWFKHCRSENQVLNTATNSKEHQCI
ncbi:hypothetical protein L7F22_036479 [Adiantum nelumboides]|nr:hypothetical protein [Adiantum nelumboides]